MAEAFTLHFATACTSYGQYHDDLLAAMQLFSDQHIGNSIADNFLRAAYRALDIRLDHAIEAQIDWLFKNVMIQRCLGVQLSLGYHGDQKPRTLSAKVAQGLLDIRAVTLIITYSVKNAIAAAGTDSRKAGLLDYLSNTRT